jgi:hypothetical protein
VNAVRQRLLAERRRERRIDNGDRTTQRAELVEVDELETWIGGCLSKRHHRAARAHSGGPCAGFRAIDQRRLDAHPLAGALQESKRSGVQLALGDDVITGGAQRVDHRGDRAHSRGERQRIICAFQNSDGLLERTHGGVGVAAVELPGADGGGSPVGIRQSVGFPHGAGPQGGRK